MFTQYVFNDTNGAIYFQTAQTLQAGDFVQLERNGSKFGYFQMDSVDDATKEVTMHAVTTGLPAAIITGVMTA